VLKGNRAGWEGKRLEEGGEGEEKEAKTLAPAAPANSPVCFPPSSCFPNSGAPLPSFVNKDPELKKGFAGGGVEASPAEASPSEESSSPPRNPESSINASGATDPAATKKEATGDALGRTVAGGAVGFWGAAAGFGSCLSTVFAVSSTGLSFLCVSAGTAFSLTGLVSSLPLLFRSGTISIFPLKGFTSGSLGLITAREAFWKSVSLSRLGGRGSSTTSTTSRRK